MMLEARKQGLNYREIARQFDCSASTAHSGVKRALRKEAARYTEDQGDAIWLILERYETILRNLLPFTRITKMTHPETGEEIRVPPSMEAIDRVHKIQTTIQKMLGLDQEAISIEFSRTDAPGIDDGKGGKEITPEDYSKKMIAELIKAGALAGPEAHALESLLGEQIMDAEGQEVVTRQLPTGPTPDMQVPSIVADREFEDAPEWVDDDDEDYQPGKWIPDDLGNASDQDG